MHINGKVAVVTGGASGIGQAVTRRIAAAGGKVVIFDLNEDAGQAMVAELGADNCVFANVNVVDEDSAKAGIEAAAEGEHDAFVRHALLSLSRGFVLQNLYRFSSRPAARS